MNPSIKENKEDGKDDDKILSHTELKRFFQEALSHLLESDPLLSDLHPQVTLEEVRMKRMNILWEGIMAIVTNSHNTTIMTTTTLVA